MGRVVCKGLLCQLRVYFKHTSNDSTQNCVQYCCTVECPEDRDWVQASIYVTCTLSCSICFCLPTVQDKDGRSALHLASLNGHASLARELITMYKLHPNTENKVWAATYICYVRMWGVVVVYLVANANFSLINVMS